MNKQWIVVSDAAEARIFSRDAANTDLTLVDTLEHHETRAHEGDLRTGGKGRSHDMAGSGERQSDPQTTTIEKHADIFAKQLAQRLKSGLNDDAFTELVIAADPSFLGRLREQLDGPLEKCVAHTIDKNWAQHDAGQIRKQLDNQLGN